MGFGEFIIGMILFGIAFAIFCTWLADRSVKRVTNERKEKQDVGAAAATYPYAYPLVQDNAYAQPLVQDNGSGVTLTGYSVAAGTSTTNNTANTGNDIETLMASDDSSTPGALTGEMAAGLNHSVTEWLMKQDSENMLERIAELESEGEGRAGATAALREIYRHFDDALKADEIEQCDAVLRGCDVEMHGVSVLLGFLTASLPAADRLPSRAPLFYRVRAELEKRGRTEEGLLAGLAPKRKDRWDVI